MGIFEDIERGTRRGLGLGVVLGVWGVMTWLMTDAYEDAVAQNLIPIGMAVVLAYLLSQLSTGPRDGCPT